VTVESRSFRRLAARTATEVFAPAVVVVAVSFLVGLHAGDTVGAGLRWGLLAALFSSVIPFGAILLGVRRGRLTDHHVGRREQRRVPLLIALGSVLVGLGVLGLAGAPREMLALVTSMFVSLGVTVVVTHWWKVSAHAAVASGGAVIAVLTLGPLWLASYVVVAIVCWSRVQLRDHTVAQVLVGAVLGVVVGGSVFVALR
jgi:membrane-associated phospholipid phosphatase